MERVRLQGSSFPLGNSLFLLRQHSPLLPGLFRRDQKYVASLVPWLVSFYRNNFSYCNACANITPSVAGLHSFPGYKDNRVWDKRKLWSQVPSGQRASYDLKERVCIGSMTAMESATYQRIPTDEAEAQMLASADLDDMKSEVPIGSLVMGVGVIVMVSICQDSLQVQH